MKIKPKLTKGNKWFRKELNDLWDALYRWTIVQPLAGWHETPDGMVPPRDRNKTPAFSPRVDGTTSKTLYIYPGYFHAPKASSANLEIPDYYLYPYMPEVSGTRLNDSQPVGLSLTDNASNYVYLQAKMVERQAIVGETSLVVSGEVGIRGFADATEGQLPVVVAIAALHYHIDEDNWPTFLVTTTDFPINEEGSAQLVANIPWGKFIMGSSGAVNSYQWFWTGDRDYNPPSHIMGSASPDNHGLNPSVLPP